MSIVRVDVERLPLTLRAPYAIAYETVDRAENLLVRVVTDGPHVGLGIAAPDEGVTGERIDDTFRVLNDVASELVGLDPLRRVAVCHGVSEALAAFPSARSALDQALLDLLGKTAGLPTWRMLGGFRTRIPTSATVFLGPVEQVVADARRLLDDGFRLLKIKGGDDPDLDEARLRAVRRLAGPDIPLLFDANQGYDAETARVLLERVADVGLAIVEQPCPADDVRALRQLTRAVPLPVMADESLLGLADAFHLARGEAVDMVNIKLAKVGGIDEALLINGVARAAGLEVMVGCMDECALSIAAGLAFALSRPNVEYADLDGHLDLLDDPTTGCVHLDDGALVPSDAPGFGLADL